MARSALTEREIALVLDRLRIVRVAFAAADARYVIPLGYTWAGEALWGSTTRGRKTELAARDSRVAFIIDDGVPFVTESVAGEGIFEIVSLDQAAPVLPMMRRRFADNPAWNVDDFAAGLADGSSVFWRITPTSLSGRRFHKPEAK